MSHDVVVMSSTEEEFSRYASKISVSFDAVTRSMVIDQSRLQKIAVYTVF